MTRDIEPESLSVETLADDFLDRIRRGERLTVGEYAVAHPALAEEINELFPTILALEEIKSSVASSPEVSSRGVSSLAHDTRLGEFRVLREIGRGGMGVVYEAVQESLARTVAVKVLPQPMAVDPRRLERFRREARTAASLRHPHIVPIYAVGEHAGVHYLAMQLIDGVGLDQVIHSLAHPTRPQSPICAVSVAAALGGECFGAEYFRQAALLIGQAADALQCAHAAGVVHRDIKPANLLLDRQARIWVTDFGLAKALDDDGLSRSGELVGTLRYLAPEQLDGGGDSRSDLYSLGLVLYELVTLLPAYPAEGVTQLLSQISNSSPESPSSVQPNVPEGLERIILRATARDPNNRYQSAAELASDLDRFVRGESPVTPRLEPALPVTTAAAFRPGGSSAFAARTTPWMTLAVVAGFAGLIGAALFASLTPPPFHPMGWGPPRGGDPRRAAEPGGRGFGAEGVGTEGPEAEGPGPEGPGVRGPGPNGPPHRRPFGPPPGPQEFERRPYDGPHDGEPPFGGPPEEGTRWRDFDDLPFGPRPGGPRGPGAHFPPPPPGEWRPPGPPGPPQRREPASSTPKEESEAEASQADGSQPAP